MSKWNVVRRCYGCGAILQSEDKEMPGYIEEKFLDSPISNKLFCDACWAQQSYSIVPAEPEVSRDFIHMMEDAKASDALIVYVVDLFSFEASFNSKLSKLLEGMKVLIIGNKRDLLPEKADNEELCAYVAHRFRVAKISVQKEDVILTNLGMDSDTSAISARIQGDRMGHDVYVIGAVQAGKTAFINAFLRSYSNKSNRYVKTSVYPGTKLRILSIPLDKSSSIYDTPGIPTINSASAVADLKYGHPEPDSEISKRSVALAKADGIAIGSLAAIQLMEGQKTALKCYFAPTTTITKFSKTPDKAVLGSIKKGIPRPKRHMTLADFDVFDIEVEEQGSRDIGIEGLGWINFIGANQTFRVIVPKGVSVYASRAKIK